MLRTLNIACNTYGSSITDCFAGVAGSDLALCNACGTCARPRTLPQEACRKRGSGASAGKPPRAPVRTDTLDFSGEDQLSSPIVPRKSSILRDHCFTVIDLVPLQTARFKQLSSLSRTERNAAQGQLDNEFSFNINKWQPRPIVMDSMVDADA
ncbi:unnamed protein product [Euphydryas editha]|uniref:Uncharacterized protein n=1 Tax=Euphydryas editha TaxID=104508 RepID=A0AAU9UXW2_EUPED|nr:unnamed protein product [Euphydryas editha]